jgi:hypothetical protein
MKIKKMSYRRLKQMLTKGVTETQRVAIIDIIDRYKEQGLTPEEARESLDSFAKSISG